MAEADTSPPADPSPPAEIEEGPPLSEESPHPHHHHSRPRHHGRQNHRHHHHHHQKHEDHHLDEEAGTENGDGDIPAMDEPASSNVEPDQSFLEQELPAADQVPPAEEPAAEGTQQKVSRDLSPSGESIDLAPEDRAQEEAVPSENPSPVHVVLPLPPPLEEIAFLENPFSALLSEEDNQVKDVSEDGIPEHKASFPQEETTAVTAQEVSAHGESSAPGEVSYQGHGGEADHGESSADVAPGEVSYQGHGGEADHGENSTQKEVSVHETDDARKEDAHRDVSTHNIDDDAQKEDTHIEVSAHNTVDAQKDGITASQEAVQPQSEVVETLQEEPSTMLPDEGTLACEEDAQEDTFTRDISLDGSTAEYTPTSGVDKEISGVKVSDNRIPDDTSGEAYSDSTSQEKVPVEVETHAPAPEVTEESNADGSMLIKACLGDKGDAVTEEAEIDEATDASVNTKENAQEGPHSEDVITDNKNTVKDVTLSQSVDEETVSKSIAPSQGAQNEFVVSEAPVNVASREVIQDGEDPYANKQPSVVNVSTANGDVKEPEAEQASSKQIRVDCEKDHFEGIKCIDITSQEVQKIEPTKEKVIESSSSSKVPLFLAAAGIVVAVAGIAVASFSRHR